MTLYMLNSDDPVQSGEHNGTFYIP